MDEGEFFTILAEEVVGSTIGAPSPSLAKLFIQNSNSDQPVHVYYDGEMYDMSNFDSNNIPEGMYDLRDEFQKNLKSTIKQEIPTGMDSEEVFQDLIDEAKLRAVNNTRNDHEAALFVAEFISISLHGPEEKRKKLVRSLISDI